MQNGFGFSKSDIYSIAAALDCDHRAVERQVRARAEGTVPRRRLETKIREALDKLASTKQKGQAREAK